MISKQDGLTAQDDPTVVFDVIARLVARSSQAAWQSAPPQRREEPAPPYRGPESGRREPREDSAPGDALARLASDLEAAAYHLRRAARRASTLAFPAAGQTERSPRRCIVPGALEEAASAPSAPSGLAALTRTGEIWTIAFGGRTAQLPHLKGLDDLVVLLLSPEREVHCLDLIGGHAAAGGPLPALDERARQQYRVRIRDLRAAIATAQADNDPPRAAHAQAELDALAQQLAASFGLGGRARPTGAAAERARSAIARRIRAAIDRIGRVHPELGRHLDNAVRSGTYCVYRPEAPVQWQLSRTPPHAIDREEVRPRPFSSTGIPERSERGELW